MDARTGGFGFVAERATVQDVIDVLADKNQFGPDGETAKPYTQKIVDSGFFDNLDLQEYQQMLRLIAQSKGCGFNEIRKALEFYVKGVVGEAE